MKKKNLIILILILLGVFISFDFFLLQGINLEIKGNQTVNLNYGDTWDDPGIIALRGSDDLTSQVVIKSDIDYQKIGSYNVEYSIREILFSKKIIRTVNILDEKEKGDLVFSLKGDSNYYLMNGNDYSEPGYNAYDIFDGDITNNVDINSNVLTNQNGDYQVVYSVKNSSGITKTITRNVTVYSFLVKKSLKTSEPANDNEITVEIEDNNYNYTLLPDGQKVTDRKINYPVSQNGDYTFEIYDKNNGVLKYIVNVTNIDHRDPIPRSYNYYTFKASDGRNHKYWLYIPKDDTGRELFPLLMYLHGDGGKSKNIKDVNNYAFPNFVDNGMDFPYMMVAPQCTDEANFTDDSMMLFLKELINYLVVNYNIDDARIIISGGSSGASGAFKMASTHKNLFSCLVIGSGLFFAAKPKELTHLPIWFFHGEKDARVDEVQEVYAKINAAGGNAKLTIIPNGGHNITETVFKDPELTKWMLAQKSK